MKNKDALHSLIDSMSKSEKRNFKMIQGNSKKSNYVKLFEVIDKQEIYDEKAIKHKFRNEKFIQHLHVIKNQLVDKILYSLREFHKDKNPNQLILDKISDADILFQRGLYEQSFRKLEKARILIEENECYSLFSNYYVVTILLWQKQGLIETSEQALQDISMTAKKYLNYQKSHIELIKVSQLLNKKMKTNGYPKNEQQKQAYKDILATEVMEHPSKAHTSKAKFNFYTNHSLLHLLLGESEPSLNNSLLAIEVMETKAQKNSNFVLDYIRGLANLLYLSITFKDFKYYNTIKEKLKNVETLAAHDSSTRKVSDLKLIELQYLVLSDINVDNARIAELINDLYDLIEKTEITPNDKITMNYYIAIGHFVLKQYEKSLDCLYQSLDSQKEVKNPLLKSTHLNIIICHYEMGNYEYLGSLLRNTKRTLENIDQYGSFETLLFNYIRKTSNAMHNSQKVKKYKQSFLSEIESISKEQSTATLYFNFIKWLNN